MNRFCAAVFAFILCCFLPSAVCAQTGLSLEVEIKNMEAAASKKGIPASERHDALVRLSRLRQLTGDIEEAARSWFEAAGAIPGRVDDDALLSCAYCLAAMGEWDRAITALTPLLPKSPRARFLNTSINAIKTGDLSELGALADNAEYSQIKPEIIFVLWKLSSGALAVSSSGEMSPFKLGGGSEMWRQRLIAEFPQTPEGRLAAGTSSLITVRPIPFWLFAGGLDSLSLTANPAPGNAVIQTAQTQSAAAVQPAAPSQPAVTQPAVVASPRLQTGIFGRQPNAQAHAANLQNAGFTPSIELRAVNGNQMWAVTIPAGSDQIQTADTLRAAGFESFLIK
ncbi:MAG: hypothetical protein FWB77_05020 [Treponema sp.]|nr:hypothetical protein [Treponema sp.]